jgi:transcriptional regulator with XRE-family HTH domain
MNKREVASVRRRICAALRDTREAAGLTQSELAQRLGVAQSYVSKVENGDRRIEVAELLLICAALGVPIVTFLKRIENEG